MRVTVELHTRDYATVYFTPSFVERLFFRRSRERAGLYDGAVWRWVGGRDIVDVRVLRALAEALRDRIVTSLVRRATAPP